jgi:hypothetical protein
MSKIFIQDYGVFGSVMTIAETKEEAIILMKNERVFDFDENKPILEFEIENGFTFNNLGDL